MQIILVHPRLAQARTLTVTRKHYALAILAFGALVLGGALLLYYLTFSHAANISVPVVRDLLLSANQVETGRKDKYLRENLDAMAIKLGQMQAQLIRLEALGERVSGLAGINTSEFNFREAPGRGGAASVIDGQTLNMQDFQSLLDNLSSHLEQRADQLNIVESELMTAKLRSKMMPTIQPVNVAYNASGFGWRIDPFNGRQAMHEGVDFIAPSGSPIMAAAGGVVIASEWHHSYGNLIDIDHGNEIITRYAHASRVHVRVGDIVKRSQRIADVGTTGRSTGPHLHFEVRVRGIPQNPAKFLGNNRQAAAGGRPPMTARAGIAQPH